MQAPNETEVKLPAAAYYGDEIGEERSCWQAAWNNLSRHEKIRRESAMRAALSTFIRAREASPV